MATKLNWIDVLFFGYRLIIDALGVELPQRGAVQFAGACSVADDPVNSRTVVTVFGTAPDGSGGYVLGTPTGGWVSVKSDDFGFRVYNSDESDFIFKVDNGDHSVTINGGLQLNGALPIADTSALGAPGSGIVIQSVAGAFRVAQYTPPSVTGSRGGNAAVASLLTTLATAGLIVDNTTA